MKSDSSNELEKRFKNFDPHLNFVVVSQILARDQRLSWKARGVFLYLATNNHKWNFHMSEVAQHSDKDGRTSTESAIKELLKCGYLKRIQRRKSGRFSNAHWELYYVPSSYYKGDHTINGKSANGHSVDGKTEYGKSASNKNQSKQISTTTSIKSVSHSHKYQDPVNPSESKSTDVKQNILNIYKEVFHRNLTITLKTRIYLNNWINKIKHYAYNYNDIDIGIKHLKYAMMFTKSKINSTSPNAIAEYTDSTFNNPNTSRVTHVNYSKFIDFNKNNRANCDELLIVMHYLFNTNIANFKNQRSIFKLLDKYEATKVYKAIKYANNHVVNIGAKYGSSNDLFKDFDSHPIKYIKKTLVGNAW